MRSGRLKYTFALLATLAAVAAVLCWRGAPTAHARLSAAGRDKISSDLWQKVGGGGVVNVVMKAAGPWNSTLDSAVKKNNGSVVKSYSNFPVRAVSLPAEAVAALAARSDVDYLALDREVKQLGHVTLTTGADAARVMANYNPAYDGAGVAIAVLDSGIDPSHTSMTQESGSASRIVVSKDFTGEIRNDDPYGHGTHVASIAAGNGQVSNGSYRGIAPGANLASLRVLNSQGRGTVSTLLTAIDWIRTYRTAYNIKVVNMSLGTAAVDSYKVDPLCLAVRSLVDAGIVVVAAAGNEGKDGQGNKIYGQIHSPGTDPSVITVGASNTFGTDARNDDTVATYSSRGPTRSFTTDALGVKHYDNLIKPDLVAPGNKIIDAQATNNLLVTQNPALDANVSGSAAREQMYLSGTSMATPVVSGSAALLLQANPKLTPNMVKMILMYTAQQLPGFNTFEQGAGQVNIEGAMRLARLVRQDLPASPAVGAALLTSAAPAPQTNIAGYQFTWAQGVVMDQTFATGLNLITKYQKIYGLGTLMSDGTLEVSGVMLSDGTLMSDGVMLSDHVLVSSGAMMSDGSPFLSCGVLMNDGTLMSDGTMMSDGVVMSDGTIMSDGVMLADVSVQASKAMIYGDNTASMADIVEAALPPNAPASLAAAAASKSQINLSWADNSADESGFHVEKSTDGRTFTQVSAAADAKSYACTGLSAGKKYYFRVRAYNSNGTSAYTAVATATTPTR
ncbi:MAG TPA: S8 family serine peptidase [Pyrinomonadaceae bacterium]|nr:S8 family serine peptidase [Pyrinomonadaceae bacterium]